MSFTLEGVHIVNGKLLTNHSPLICCPALSLVFGQNEAMFLQQLQYWLRNPCTARNIYEGHRWVINSSEQWVENFPFLSESTIKRVVKTLRALGVLVTDSSQKDKFTRTLMYRIDQDMLSQRFEEGKLKAQPSLVGKNLRQVWAEVTFHAVDLKGQSLSPYSVRLTLTQGLEVTSPKCHFDPIASSHFDTMSTDTNKRITGEEKLALKTDEKTTQPDRERKEKMNSTAYEVSARALASAKAKKSEVKIPKQPYRIWQHFYRIHFDGKDLVKFVGEDIGKLNHTKNALGDNFTDVTDCVLGDWRSFGAFALKQKGLTTYPTEPQTGFYLVHCDSALDFYQKGKEVALNDAESPSESGGLVLPSWMNAHSLQKGE